ncbi:MAG: SDR family oxidoreductase [Lewinellaceae bacterium]|nr:SDR family oxidoreductase [Lewinellaceae bacterium]
MKTVVVTGANRGIGKEIARQLARLQFRVVLTARDLDKAERAAREIAGEVIPMALDVTREDSAAAFGVLLRKKVDQVDVLVNNAGIIGSKRMTDFDLDELQAVVDTNFFGALRTTKAVMPLLQNSPDARIINISTAMSEWASLASGGYAGYRLSKVGLNAFTVLLASELGNRSIRVNAVCPGWVRTDMGGPSAPLPVEKGAETAVWLATEPDIPTGKFFQDKKVIPW